ncbi:MAG: alpha-galactosidase [Planctomycetota bacterium]
MAKIVFIGAGSLGFTRGLVRDLLTFPTLRDATISLVDINPERLAFAVRAVKSIIERGGYPARVEAHLDRRKALPGADFVVCTILAGGVQVWRHDIEIPMKYGVDINIGDTRGVAGIFRALRTVPVMRDIARDIERFCPDALLLNYTNPMAMLCRAMQRATDVRITGLCHSVQGTAGMLARWIGAPMGEITYVCAGLNHQAWYIAFKRNGKDVIPHLRKKVATDRKIYREELVRNEMFLHLGYYVTESSGHNSEYNWWFRKRPDLVRRYCAPHAGAGWNPGEHGYILKRYLHSEKHWKQEMRAWFAKGAPINLERGGEYAACIMNALLGGEPFEFNGNVPNTGLVENLIPHACVEVPVLANRRGLIPLHVGALPPQCAALNNLTIASEEMAVEAALTGDADLVFQAVAIDPLTAAVLSLAEIRKMTDEMLRKNRFHLPQFKSLRK